MSDETAAAAAAPVKAAKKDKSAPSHPTYKEMIVAAIVALGLGDDYETRIKKAIAKGADEGYFVQPKGPSGTVKLSKDFKKEEDKKVKKQAEKAATTTAEKVAKKKAPKEKKAAEEKKEVKEKKVKKDAKKTKTTKVAATETKPVKEAKAVTKETEETKAKETKEAKAKETKEKNAAKETKEKKAAKAAESADADAPAKASKKAKTSKAQGSDAENEGKKETKKATSAKKVTTAEKVATKKKASAKSPASSSKKDAAEKEPKAAKATKATKAKKDADVQSLSTAKDPAAANKSQQRHYRCRHRPHLNNSRSQRVIWLLEELGLNYEIKKYQRGSDQRAPKELEQVHSLGKSPVITDGLLVIAESGAIIEYLVDTYGNGRMKRAAGTPEALQYTHWMHFAEGKAPLANTTVQKFGPRSTGSP
ncbi:hypothetical protein HDU87_008444 [Geranomyces variabilis]|uniref:Histone H1 n=1 Tax=Geranomyces variabilis TaxID=109894 RepID=A0AAD5TI92_9FUNG|nr:hypothetical protein HDU87_008444 [Geranomyces variabilis]